MFGIIKKMFIVLLASIVTVSNHAKCMSLSNQNARFIKLDRCVGSCNTLNDLSNKVCVPNRIEDLNLSVFNLITGIHESKTLTNHISCECKCKFDGRKFSSDQWWNNDKCQCGCKKCLESCYM